MIINKVPNIVVDSRCNSVFLKWCEIDQTITDNFISNACFFQLLVGNDQLVSLFCTNPEIFVPIFVGKRKDCPEPSELEHVYVIGSGEDDIVVYAVSPIGVDLHNSIALAEFIIPLAIPVTGGNIIYPKDFLKKRETILEFV